MPQALANYIYDDPHETGAPLNYVRGSAGFKFPIEKEHETAEPSFEAFDATYEQSIINFICDVERDDEQQPGATFIIRGGMGAGKSTVIRHCLNKAKKELEKRRPGIRLRPLYLQFNGADGSLLSRDEAKNEEAIWIFISRHFENEFVDKFTDEEELGEYWPWIADQPQLLAMLPTFGLYIEAYKTHIGHYARNRGYGQMNQEALEHFLINKRAEAYQQAQPIERHKYLMAKALFREARTKLSTEQKVVVLDNVDQLPPSAQIQIINVGFWLASALKVPLIVAVRPLTWANIHSARSRYVHDHVAPDIAAVVLGRLRRFKKRPTATETQSAIIDLIDRELSLDKSHLRRFLYGSSGYSVRAALKNLANFIISPDVESHVKKDRRLKMEPSHIGRAYFFGASDTFQLHNIQNLYSLHRSIDLRFALLKGRILHWIRECQHRCDSGALLEHVCAFGFHPEVVRSALNNMMPRVRSLIWSDHGLQFDSQDELAAGHNIALTPMGVSYLDRLFGEYAYVEACMASRSSDIPSPERVIEFSRDLIHEDERQIRAFVKSGLGYYEEIYPKARPSLAYMHWTQFQVGAIGRVGEDSSQFDKGWTDRILDFCRKNVSADTYA